MHAREFLSQRGIAYESLTADAARLDRAAVLRLAGQATRFLVKTREGIVRLDTRQRRPTEDEVASYLIHRDGLLNVPVLVLGDLLVRGYTDELYREALQAVSAPPE